MAAAGYPKFDSDFYDKYSTKDYYLSRGASGNVFGPIPWNGLKVALKQVMLADGYVTDKVKKDIEEKKVIWTSIEHKNLLKIHSVDLNRLPKAMFIVMDYAVGGSLNRTLRSLGSENKLPIDVVTDWAKQIAEGMLYLHDENIVHRDLKSSNILLMKSFDIRNPHTTMTLKITDFDEVKENDHTATMSALIGTYAYMAPEVLQNQRCSKASDVWSFGVVIWEMLSGDIPHKELEPIAIIRKSQAGKLDDLPLQTSFPEDHKLILKRCWKSTKERLTFQEIFGVLQRMAAGKDVTEILKLKGNMLQEAIRDTAKGSSKNFTFEPPLPLFTTEGADDRESLRHTKRKTAVVEPKTSVSEKAATQNKDSTSSKQSGFQLSRVFRGKVSSVKRRERDELSEKYQSDPVLVETMTTKAEEGRKKSIRGMTILDKELFIVSGMSSEVEVYDLVKLSFSRRRNLKELLDPMDIASCNKNKCLYIFDGKGIGQANKILRFDPRGNLIKNWSTGDDYGYGLSVTNESNVILPVYNRNQLNEYSPDGQLIREINLSTDDGIRFPWHAIKLSNGHFVVSHGSGDDPQRVCILDADGKPERLFSGNPGQMNRPNHLVVDGNGFVMVAARDSRRVLLLDSQLELKREILSKEKHELRRPMRILLDEPNGRLFVADNEWGHDGRILIFKL